MCLHVQCTGLASACFSDRDNCSTGYCFHHVLSTECRASHRRYGTTTQNDIFIFDFGICGGTGAAYNTKIMIIIAHRVFSTGKQKKQGYDIQHRTASRTVLPAPSTTSKMRRFAGRNEVWLMCLWG